MSLASSRVGLKHRCTVERRTLVPDGGGGHTETWAAVETDLACRAWHEAPRVEIAGDKVVEVEERRLVVPLDADVQVGDRIAEVTERGAVIFAGPFPVDTIGRYPDHLLVCAREVT